MDRQQYNILDLLEYIDPSMLDYTEWVSVGMALKDEGHTAADFDAWSRRDIGRYHPGECFKKWDTFKGSATPVTAGTVVQMAKDGGWTPPHHENRELGWDDIIGSRDDLVVIDKNWLEGREVLEPNKWNPVEQLVKYLETLFQSTENVGYVTSSWEKDGRHMPTKGASDRTAGELIQQLNNCKGDIGSVLGDYKPEVGAWIRFNPLDGKGVKNDNVTEFRYALVESDDMELDKQNAIIRELELPVACLVHSGDKSIHAIVKIDASNYDEYRKRVDYLYEVCKKNGLKVDTQNKNPSRLSRMPGIMRNGQKQFLIDTNIGKDSWGEWKEWIEGINDDLPEPENIGDLWDDLPDLSPPLIHGMLRQGHKLLLAGPSKAGKSYSLIELCISIAEGKRWLNWDCAQGKIMYVNLELDRASCLHRFKDVYTALKWEPKNLSNIDIWNLRGKSVPMDKLAPKLIRRAMKKDYIAIVIDPIYKVITGDENSADQMAHFVNQFDKICTELGSAVIYCHHHSKGGQGNKKSMDRASGSGVFARDPDALLDLIELELTEDILNNEVNKALCDVCADWLNKYAESYMDDRVSQDDMCSQNVMMNHCEKALGIEKYKAMQKDLYAAKEAVMSISAWRIEGTLREFPKFKPVNLWFNYPIHKVDTIGILKDIDSEGSFTSKGSPYRKNFTKKKSPEEAKKERKIALEQAVESSKTFNENGQVTINDLVESMGVSDKTVRNRIKEHGGYWIDEGKIGKK